MSKKGIFCVDTNSKIFKDMSKRLDVHPDVLENLIHQIDAEGEMALDELEKRIKETIKETSTTPISNSTNLYNALKVWNKYTQDGLVEFNTKKEADKMQSQLEDAFGKENVYRYKTASGKHALRVAKPVKGNDTQTKKKATSSTQTSTSSKRKSLMAAAKDLVDSLIDYSNTHIKFNSKDHSYEVDGKKANTSVTQYVHGKKDIGAYGVPSSALGNTVDRVTRDFFSGNLQTSYPNLSKAGLKSLVSDLKRFQKILDKKFGGRDNYQIVTDDFYISAKYSVKNPKTGKITTKTMAGAMDMLIYDKDGNFYIYDMKTTRSGLSEENIEAYSKQLALYKAILEANFPELKGKIKETRLIPFDVTYDKPAEKGGNTNYTVDEEGQLYANGVPVQDVKSEEFAPPSLSLIDESGLVETNEVNLDTEFEAADDFIKEIIEEEVGKPKGKKSDKNNKKETTEETSNVESNTEETTNNDSLYNNPLLSPEERTFLAEGVMKNTSFIISQLQSNPKYINELIDILEGLISEEASALAETLRQFVNTDFTSMNRKDIIETIGLNNVFSYVKEVYYNALNRDDIENEDTIDKLMLTYDNWEALKLEGYTKLIMLEDCTVIPADEVIKEGIDAQMAEDMDSGNAEQHEREYWQVHFRQMSTSSHLSAAIRRELERTPILELDANGELHIKLDPVFGMPMYVDSSVAVTSINDWTKDCETVEEMEEALRGMVQDFPWVASVVGIHEDGLDVHGLMEDEPFRSQFFTNFRRDATTYSIVRVEVDSNGNRHYVTQIINTKSASQFLIDQVVNSYLSGTQTDIIIPIKGDLEGKGKVNTKKVDSLKKQIEEVEKSLRESAKRGQRAFAKERKESVETIVDVLQSLGIKVTTENVQALLNSDKGAKEYEGSRTKALMAKLNAIFNTLNKFKDTSGYNPLLKGQNGNLYQDFADIVNMFSKFIQDGIEASAYENGKMYYSFQTPSALLSTVRNLKNATNNPEKFKEYVNENYLKYRWFYDSAENTHYNTWLEQLINDANARKNFEHKVQLAFNNADYRELSEVSYTLSLMSEFFSEPGHTNKLAWYRVPILSNKPSSEFIKFTRYSGKHYKSKILKGLQSTTRQEILRIRTVLDNVSNPNSIAINNFDISDKILKNNPIIQVKLNQRKELEEQLDKGEISQKEYDKKIKSTYLTHSDLVKDGKFILADSGASFKFLSALNDDIVKNNTMGQMLIDQINGIEYSEDDDATFVAALEEALNNHMDALFASEREQWAKIGLFETEEKEYTWEETIKGYERSLTSKARIYTSSKKTIKVKLPSYKYLGSFIQSPEAIYKKLIKQDEYKNLKKNKDGTLNSKLQEAIMQEMNDQLNKALENYVWNDLFATINIIQLTATDLAYFKNIEDFQKRFAAVHSPGMRMNTTAKDENGNLYSDGYCRVLHLNDSLEKSEIIENVRQVFDAKIEKAKTSKEKQDWRKMRDLILSGYENFNITDGQGYSSPTSYRKKMGMLGRWTKAEEKAYERIRKGNFNLKDLEIIWQPLKPFIYTQMSKTTGSDIMSEIKVPMQVKDSEYMLLLADALMRGGNKQNKLTAIFDFMEDSAYDGRVSDNGKVVNEGTYNAKGIDTIAFVSTSKFGSSGVVDLTEKGINKFREENEELTEGMSDYEVMKAMLNDAAYYNSDHTDDSNNNNDRYDDRYVHTFSYKDYALQQEVPSHFLDHEQAMGSQVRILSVSDIHADDKFSTANGEINGRDLVKEYQELQAANIRASFEQLEKEFKLNDPDPKVRNKALEKILRQAILKDQRYGADLLRACTLNKNGEFTIPLNDPIQSTRIQQLLNSIIKSRINKQKTNGGPVVQTSVFGMSDDLNIRFKDKNGNLLNTFAEYKEKLRKKKPNISDEAAAKAYKKYVEENQGEMAYWEVYMPIPSEAMEKALRDAGKKNGKDYFNDVEAAVKDGVINEEQLKAIGYRIPTESKYSMAPLRVKGFMPKAAGEALMMPKEITLLTGSDFDIDKMYIMVKEFSQDDVYNIEEAWEDFYQNSDEGQEARRFIDEAKEREFQKGLADMAAHPEKYEDWQDMSEEELRKMFMDVAKEQGLDRDYKWVEGVQKAFSKWFNKEKQQAHLKGKGTFRELKGKGNRSGRNNRIFDLQWAVLTSSSAASEMFNPGSFDPQKKIARIVNILKDSNNKYSYEELEQMSLDKLDSILSTNTGKDIMASTTQVYFHRQNMTAGKLIGIFANANTSHAFISMQDIRLALNDKYSFTFNGDTISDDKMDPITSRDGVTLVSKTIASFLAASVDAVKDPVLNFLNLNTFTSSPAMVLARLGFDTNSIGLFLTQPIIEKAAEEYFKRNNDEYISQDDIIKELKDQIKKQYGIDSKVLESDLVNTDFKKNDLAKGLQNQDLTKMSSKEAEFQLRALMLFQRLTKIGNQLQDMTFLTKFNSISNAPGPNISDTLVMRERYNKFKQLFVDGNNLFSESAADIIENSPILSAFYDTTVSESGASSKIFGQHFPHYTNSFLNVLSRLTSYIRSTPDAKLINTLVNDYMYYILTSGENPVFDTSRGQRLKFIQKFVDEFKKNSPAVGTNALVDIVQINSANSKCPVPTLQTKTGSFNASKQEAIKNAWSSLIQNEETRDFGINFFYYNIMRTGFGFSPKSSTHLASVDVKLAIPGYVQGLRNMDVGIMEDDFIYQFMRNHCTDYKLVPRVKENKGLSVKEYRDKITFTFEKESASPTPAFVLDPQNIDSNHLAPVIWYNNRLYMRTSTEEFIETGLKYSITYTETTPLGNNNNFLEYNANSEEGGAEMKTAMTQPFDRELEEYNLLEKDSSEAEEVSSNEVMEMLTEEEQGLLLNEIFKKSELDTIQQLADSDNDALFKNTEHKRKIFNHYIAQTVMKHLNSNRAIDVQYRKELAEISEKMSTEMTQKQKEKIEEELEDILDEICILPF